MKEGGKAVKMRNSRLCCQAVSRELASLRDSVCQTPQVQELEHYLCRGWGS